MSTRLTTQQILARQAAEQEAVARAQNPADLTDADLRVLPAGQLGDLMREGKLGHLGLGGQKPGSRRR